MERKSSGLKETMYSWVISEMRSAENIGMPVKVDGKYYTMRDAAHLHRVMENRYYMKSYIGDEHGRIQEINFDHITEF